LMIGTQALWHEGTEPGYWRLVDLES